ncbi:MAG: hypothetical protein OHK005_00770 [Candidatus Methylacidiphilales bacterium]
MGEVNGTGPSPSDNLEGTLDIVGNAEFCGKNVHGADGKNTEGCGGAGDAVDHFIDGAIAPGGDDGAKAFLDSLAGEDLGVSGAMGQFKFGFGQFGANAGNEFAGTFSLGSRIENDTTIF